eukprot:gene39986-30681_t
MPEHPPSLLGVSGGRGLPGGSSPFLPVSCEKSTGRRCGSIAAMIDRITDRNYTRVSLADVGYRSVGIDEGWEGCGEGRFPDMARLVQYGQQKGLSMGWYLNGCACPFNKDAARDRAVLERNYEGDVRALGELGFDAVKLDGCGVQRNNTHYAALMNSTGRRFETVIPYTQRDTPLSVPSCWAYPDMLEVGQIMQPANNSELDLPWNRAHFGAWCVVSSPLVLGLDLGSSYLPPIIPIITNAEAIQVNQQYAGHPGMLLKSIQPEVQPNTLGFYVYSGALSEGSNFGQVQNLTLPGAEAWCNRHQRRGEECYGFTTHANTTNTTAGPVHFKARGMQRPQPDGAWAVLFVNGAVNTSMKASISLSSDLKVSGPLKAPMTSTMARTHLYDGGSGWSAATVAAVLTAAAAAFAVGTKMGRR